MKETMATTPPSASNTAAKAAKYREMAKDKSLPQDVRNVYLDKANEIEQASYKPSMAKGGMVKDVKMAMGGDMANKSMMNYGGMAMKQPMMAKGGAVAAKAPAKAPAKAAMKASAKGMSKSPSIVIAVGMAKPSKKPMMNKGGSVKGKC
jgi:hypothetical protein